MFGKIVIVNNELMKNKGTPESQTFKKKKLFNKRETLFFNIKSSSKTRGIKKSERLVEIRNAQQKFILVNNSYLQ